MTLVLLGSSLAFPQKVDLLWPAGAPGAIGAEDRDKPSIAIHIADAGKANGAAVIVCPGGSYNHLAMDHEGTAVARWLNNLGISAFVLTYRIAPAYHHPAPLLDLQRAIRTIRARAGEFKIDPARLGVWGSSAGGHLAAAAGTQFDDGNAKASDPVDRPSSRPDFLVLAYPVISLTAEYAHKGSRNSLVGNSRDPHLAEKLSADKNVSPRTPPTFLFHTDEDAGVPPENSVAFYLALRKANVPAELHIYRTGKHGVGLAEKDPVLSTWPARVADWLRVQGIIPASHH